ncbi:MAG: glycosyltransferase family 4 protein [Pseudomonadota bacterium]
MKIIQLYNNYKSGGGGEKIVVSLTNKILEKHGHQVCDIERDSRTIVTFMDKISAFVNGIYSWQAKREMVNVIDAEHPDIVHAHNLYPLLSPSVLVACRQRCIPVVMTVHHFGLTCPAWHHFARGRVCERCLGGREYWCILKNCREDRFESVGYALRSTVARKCRMFSNNVTLFMAVSESLRRQLIKVGFDGDRIILLPNCVPLPVSSAVPLNGEYIAFVGRLSSEKGIYSLITAGNHTGLPIRIAGNGPIRGQLEKITTKNITFVGHLEQHELVEFYCNSRFLVVPSICYEAFGLVLLEAMSHSKAVIASRIGGIQEIVDDGITGLLFEAGNVEDLVKKMRLLWANPNLCEQMGQEGRRKMISEYTEEAYYNRLLRGYEQAIEMNNHRKV